MTVSNTWLQMTKQMFKLTAAGTADLGNGTQFTAVYVGSNSGSAALLDWSTARWDWPSEGNEQATAVYATAPLPANATYAQAISVIYPAGSIVQGAEVPTMTSAMDPATGTVTLNVSVAASTDVVTLFSTGTLGPTATGPSTASGSPLVTLARVSASSHELVASTVLSTSDVSYTKPQGDISMTVLGAGYDFGQIPEDVALSRASSDATYPWPPNSYFGNHALVV
jgi:hypothetical protein